jgi:hypothetical protein
MRSSGGGGSAYVGIAYLFCTISLYNHAEQENGYPLFSSSIATIAVPHGGLLTP